MDFLLFGFAWCTTTLVTAAWAYKAGRASVREEAEAQRKFLKDVTESMCKDRGCWVKGQVEAFNAHVPDASDLGT